MSSAPSIFFSIRGPQRRFVGAASLVGIVWALGACAPLSDSKSGAGTAGNSGRVEEKAPGGTRVASETTASPLASGGVQRTPVAGDADFPTEEPSPRHAQKVVQAQTGHFDLILVGDSITHTVGEMPGTMYEPLREVWDRHFAPRKALNLGHNGFRTENILWNLQNGELDLTPSPKVAVVLIGTNNADDRNFRQVHTAEEIANGTRAIVEAIRQRHPTTKVLLLRIFPRGGDGEEGNAPRVFHSSAQCIQTCRRAGELTARLADGKQVFWLDVGGVFLRPNGTINTNLMPDLLHPNLAGAEAWAQAMEPTLAKLLGDRPILERAGRK